MVKFARVGGGWVETGNVVVELALGPPLLLLMLAGIVDLGTLYWKKQILTTAAGEGAEGGLVGRRRRVGGPDHQSNHADRPGPTGPIQPAGRRRQPDRLGLGQQLQLPLGCYRYPGTVCMWRSRTSRWGCCCCPMCCRFLGVAAISARLPCSPKPRWRRSGPPRHPKSFAGAVLEPPVGELAAPKWP